jgi:hypothetical protein
MSLSNYRDISNDGSNIDAGFQFEFYCGSCGRTWKSPFEPYRRGQLAGLVYKLSRYLGDRGSLFRASNTVASLGAKGAHENALQNALEVAEQRYAECPGCVKSVCDACWNESAKLCESCSGKGGRSRAAFDSHDSHESHRSGGQAEASAAGQRCPNCSTALSGGRFCAECGFDMASTHKSCPGCGAMCARSTRFCTDCGHGF